ncbi:hypothetical protein [Rarobacter incanus]|uniref:UDP-N-acetylmuramyl pentapeptide phosphotransferase/UDP-N-acetylglucosamine-1-phosphate transferase n=1 Tax=Rarobacter incanus TaxID=153494 RepID=A0A542SLV5_9MICO|nr:hypothetical protein [Rarobacter incanus]TQK75548.1 hypothetical protein FB389_0178 [Rarobacter incanus]
MSKGRTLAAALGAAATGAACAWGTRAIIAQRARTSAPLARALRRENYRGEQVTLAEGPALAVALTAAQAVNARMRRDPGAAACAPVVAAAGLLGALDDFADPDPKRARGLRGHLRALRAGTVTTGAVKLVGIALAAGGGALVLEKSRSQANPAARCVRVATDTALIAATTNLVNLFDLRPGRAVKAASLLVAPLGAQSLVVLGPIAAVAVDDVRGRSMAGDAGANALGASVAMTWARHLPTGVKVALTIVVVGLNLASERVSFSAVIDANPVLAWIDALGRASAR